MSDTADVCYTQGKMLTYDAAVMLEAIAADLRQRELSITGENGPVRVAVPGEAKLEIVFKQKIKTEKSKQKLAIEITWKEIASTDAAEAPGTDAA